MTAICFDMYGTLCDTTSVRTAIRDELDVSDALASSVEGTWRSRQLQYSYQLSLMGSYRPFWTVTRDALAFALERFDLDPSETTRTRILDSYTNLTPFPDALETLDTLSEEGYAVAVLSNGNPEMLETLASNTGFAERLDAIISAEAVGTYKPSPAVYRNAADELGEHRSDCWLVSGNAWDVAGAGNAGLSTVWVDRKNDPFERIGTEPDETVNGLSRVVDAVSED